MITFRLSIFAFLLTLASCSRAVQDQGSYAMAYREGYVDVAAELCSGVVADQMPHHHYRESKDAVWLLLDEAMTHFVAGDGNQAVASYREALEAIDYYRQAEWEEIVGQVALQDDVAAYGGDHFEQLLARFYFALALLHIGDESNAYAVLRGFEEEYQLLKEYYRNHKVCSGFPVPDIAVAKRLFAAVLEQRGDLSNAKIVYRETGIDVCEQGEATLLVVCHNGNVPHKISSYCESSLASTIALELFLQETSTNFAVSSLPPVAVPTLVSHSREAPQIIFVKIDDGPYERPEKITCVSDLAFEELIKRRPVIAARAIARRVMRRGVVAALDAQDKGLGFFADLAMLFANAATEADTRSWQTLPARIDMVRYPLSAGEHRVKIAVEPGGPWGSYQECDLCLAPGDLCVLNLFVLHPGVSYLLVPERYQGKKS